MPTLTAFANHSPSRLTDADIAYEFIKGRIISLELPPGSAINQQDLVEELRVSRTPIREALKRLENESLVVAVHRRGMSVAEVSLTDLRDVYEIRVELEAASARLTAQRASDEQVSQIERVLEELVNTDLCQRRLIAERERQLHFEIAEYSQSRYLRKEIRHYYSLALRIWYLLIDRLPSGSEDIPGHIEVVEAIRRRDSKLAETLMRAHVKAVFDTVKVHL
jgi:DNA-binding GntR family transcriptional regulator